MNISDFDYDLPEELIAQVPVEPRDAARLLIDRGSEAPDTSTVASLVDELRPGDLIVVNETRVQPARLHLHKRSGGAVEILLLEQHSDDVWEVLARPGRRLRPGIELTLDNSAVAVIEGRADHDRGSFLVRLLVELDVLTARGEMPLPPYITAPLQDHTRYQTIFAASGRSAAAPTAGLHFTQRLLDGITQAGVDIARVDLVVGLDTFRPVSVEDLDDHVMHSERYSVPAETLERCREARRVIAVGTTSVRALESAAARGSLSGRTDLFIRAGHDWQIVDMLLTNFHLPRSTLLVMIDAFIGPRWRDLYAHAIAQRFRMLSFGDAMLLNRHAV